MLRKFPGNGVTDPRINLLKLCNDILIISASKNKDRKRLNILNKTDNLSHI